MDPKTLATTLMATLTVLTTLAAPPVAADHPTSKDYVLTMPVVFDSSVPHVGATVTVADDNLDNVYIEVDLYSGDIVFPTSGCGSITHTGAWDKAVVRVQPPHVDLDTLEACAGSPVGTIHLISHD